MSSRVGIGCIEVTYRWLGGPGETERAMEEVVVVWKMF
jgi:hypothetical protein